MKCITLVATLLMLSSCASIVSKSNWPVAIGTSPTGANLTIVNKKGIVVFTGTTPAALRLKSGSGFFGKESYQVKFSMAGFDEKTIPLDCKLNGWYFGNILIGGLIGMLIVDPATGAMYKLDTDNVHEKLSITSVQASPSLNILGIDQVPADMRKTMVLIERK